MPGRIPSEGRPPRLPHTYHNIPHGERPEYGRNLPIKVLIQLRCEASRAAYEEGILEPYQAFDCQSSDSLSSVRLED